MSRKTRSSRNLQSNRIADRIDAPPACLRRGKDLPLSRRAALAVTISAAVLCSSLAWGSTSPQIEEPAPLVVPRTAHTATLLSDGRVLIVGGRDAAGTALAAAEIFDPANGTSTAIGAMLVPRTGHAATLLNNGRVLIAGGTNATGPLTSAEIFDPSALEAGFRLLGANMGTARTQHTATLLSSGKVLIAGGDNGGTAEIFDPATETFSSTLLLMADPRSGHTASLFSGDTVLLAGGQTDSMELFNVADQTFTLDSNKMSSVRTGGAAITLGDRRVLFFGGDTNNTLEEFDLPTDTLILQASMDAPASSATLLANDKILVLRPDVAGVYNPDGAPSASGTELEVISDPAIIALQRSGQTATEIRDGRKILVAGGVNAQNQFVAPVALFNPARIWTDKDDYQPDEPVVLSGSGWKANENIYLFAVDSATEQWTYESTVQTDANGDFSVSPYFIVQLRHLGVTFTVNAVGAQSNMQADVEFTDAINFQSVTVGPQNGTAVAGSSGASLTYQVTANYSGSGSVSGDPVTWSFAGFTGAAPNGVSTSFSATTATNTSPNSTLTITTTSATTTAGTFTFTVRGTPAAGTAKTQTGTLTIGAGSAAKYLVTSSDSNPVAGTAVTITAQLADANGNAVSTAGKTVTWSKTGAGGSFASATSTTNASGVATVSFTTGTSIGTVYTVTATDNMNLTGTSGNITTRVGAAAKYLVTSSDNNPAAGTAVTITAQLADASGNAVSTAGKTVTWSKTGTGGSFASATSTTNASGVATVSFTTGAVAGTVYTVTATDNTSLTGTSGNITTKVGSASKLALSGATTDLTSGSTRTLTATIQDAAGNTITTGADSTLSVTFAKTSGAGTVTGLGSSTAVAGVATLTVTGNQSGAVTITATANGSGDALAAGAGNPITFNVVTAALHHFGFANIGSQTAGTAFNNTITAQDLNNNTVTTFDGNGFKVMLTSTGTLSAGSFTTPAFTLGVLTQSVAITNTGNFTITATGIAGNSGITGTSNSFAVNAGAASKLAFSQQPTTTIAGQTISAVKVQIQDANGNLTNSNASVGIAISSNPGSGTLSDTTPVAAVNGTVTFSDLSIDRGGTGYTLQASSTGLTSATSASFTINNPAPTLTSIAPDNGNLSDTLDVVFNGTNYISGVSSVSFGADTTVNSVTVNSSTKITANITIGSGATVGARNVSVINSTPGGGTSATQSFTVNNPTTTTTLDSSLNPSTYGELVTFTATVSSVSGTPTGTTGSVTFYDSATCSGTVLAGPTNVVNGHASFTASSLTVPGHTITACYSPTGIYLASNGSVTQTVNKATATVTLESLSQTYDGSPKVATATTTPAGLSVSFTYNGSPTAPTNAGSYAVVGTIGDPNYTGSANGTFMIGKANATITVTPYDVTYDGVAHTATGTAKGVGGVSLTGLDLSGTTHTNAGTYTDSWTFTDSTGNYNDASSTITDKIGKADATITADGYTGVYDGNAHGATGSAKGVNNEDLSSSLDLGQKFTDVPGGTANWSFNGGTNYNSANGTAAITISKAEATITVNGYTGAYDGNAHGAAGAANGVKGENLDSLLDLGEQFTDVPGGTAHWSFAGNGSYKSANGTANIVISKANATIQVDGYTGIYDGDPHGATGSAKGVKNEDLSALLHLGNSFTYVPGGTANWTFDGNTNYNSDGGTVAIVISKANATIQVDGYTGVYDGDPHGATGSVKGVKNEDLSSLLHLGNSFTNVPGGTANWTFDGNGNYNSANGTAAITISKANAAITVDGYTGVYDRDAHGATGSAKGVKNEDLSTLLHLGASFTDVPGGTANWTFDGNANYNSDAGTAAIVINKANATIEVDGYTDVYDGEPHGATGSAKGVKNEDLNALLHLGNNFTDVPGGTANWTFDGNNNYNSDTGTAAITISKANATIVVTPYEVTYDGEGHTATGSAKGVKGESLTGLNLSGTTHTNAGTYTDSWTYTDSTGNYNDASSTVTDKIGKATATISVTPYSVSYDGNEHTATGSATGVKGEALTGLDLSGSKHTNAGTYADTWSFTNANYKDAGDTVNDQIAKANANITVTPYHVIYDGDPHTASGSATGVKGESLSGLTITGTTHTNAGTYNGDQWTFTDVTGNYNNASSTVDDKIDKANPVITVTPYSVTYDGLAHTATGSATGVKGEALSGLDLSGTTHTNAGTYNGDGWSFTDVTGNYNNTNSTVNDKINKATLTIKGDDKQIVLNAALPTFTVTYTGFVANESASNLGGTLAFTPTTSPTAVGTYPITPTGLTSNNYNITFTVGTLTVKYAASGIVLGSPSHAILQPINTDGSSVFKSGSTVPAKFRVSDAAGNSIGAPGVVTSFKLIAKTSDPGIAVNEDVTSTTPDTVFRWDPTGMQWIFNVSTKGMAPSVNYTYLISLNDGSTIQFSFALK
jgi:hypothetical protein